MASSRRNNIVPNPLGYQDASATSIFQDGMSIMKKNQLRKGLMAATLAAGLMSAPAAFATPPAAGDLAITFNPFGGDLFSSVVTGQRPAATAPQFALGYFVSNDLMPYAYLSIDDIDGASDTAISIGGGVRAYIGGISQRLRPFAGGAFGLINANDTDISLGGFFGAEAMIVNGFSVSGQIGADLTMLGCNGCGTNVNLGTSSVMFNFYF